MSKITLITGGQRSGKSNYAQKMALALSPHPVYIATSRVWDEEHRQRINKHKADRGPQWTSIEEEKELSKHNIEGKVILIDCVTLWATNYFFDMQSETEVILNALKSEFDRFTTQDATYIFVTNEIGMGEMSQNEIQRKFADLQGWINQYIAQKADDVYLMVSGIPVKIK